MAGFAQFISAVAALLWPLFAFTLLILFHKEIRRLISRIKRGKILGQEVELETSLTQLQTVTTAAVLDVSALPSLPLPTQLSLPSPAETETEGKVVPSSETDAPPTPPHPPAEENIEAKILEEAARSPKAALLLLSSELERAVREIVANLGLLQGRRFLPIHQGLGLLMERGALPESVANGLQLFLKVRGRIVHGGDADEDLILRAIDSGISLLKAIRAIPHAVKVVFDPNVEIYRDVGLTERFEGARGVLLEMESPDGEKSPRIFPSTRTHFRKGMRVAWEWNMHTIFDQAWYRDRATGDATIAWLSSAEFVGRDLDAL